jgi:hypothetical protein
MNEHSRSIGIRHHAVWQAYIKEEAKIGGVKTTENPAPINMQHASALNIHFKTTSISETTKTPILTTTSTY